MSGKFRAIKPKPINNKAASKALADAAKKCGEFIRKDYDRVTAGWNGERPVWKVTYVANQYQAIISVRLANPSAQGGKKWIWLDQGTKPHLIAGNPILAFQPGSAAGSKPGNLRTFGGSRSGDTVFARQVQHPGIEPREWSQMLQEQSQDMFAKWMDPYMKDVARATGHSV